MKIRIRFILLLVSVVVTITGLSLFLKSKITNENKSLLSQKLAETKEVNVKKALELQSAALKNYAYDYSMWDQMVDFLKVKKDSAWVNEEVDIALGNYKIDYIWILDTAAGEYYFTTTKPGRDKKSLQISSDSLKQKLQADHFRHFFIQHDNQWVDVYAAPIQPTTDKKRQSEPFGFLLLGRSVDSTYISDLTDILPETDVRLVAPGDASAERINADDGTIQFHIPFYSIDGAPLVGLNVSRAYPVLVSYRNYLDRYLLAFIAVVFFIGVFFFFITKKLLFNPLNTLSHSLSTKNAASLFTLSKSKTEYGELSQLVISFFEQNEKLEKEIESRKQSELALQEALKEKEIANIDKIRAEQAALAKSQFLSTMSHEIRTPINGVIGISNLLMEENLTERQKEYVHTLNYSAQNLMSIVSDILDFSKIDSGSLHFEKVSFNLETVCQHVFDLFKNKAVEKSIEYTFSPAPIADFSLYGDHVRLSQVLANLLSNAVKFTDKGKVDFSYAIKADHKDAVTLQFRVKDTGIGIPQQQHNKIFDSFSQADDSITRRYGGTGLGLTISKKLVELQGGSIFVNSIHGKGSTFMVELTFDKHVYADEQLLKKQQQKTNRNELDGMKILVAEDNSINAMVLTRFLNKWNVQSRLAKDGSEAIRLLQEERFDIILMDLQMPNMDGMEATRLIRQSEKQLYKNIPIVALTADALMDTQRMLLRNGFNHCITKPFNPEVLFNYLKKHYKAA